MCEDRGVLNALQIPTLHHRTLPKLCEFHERIRRMLTIKAIFDGKEFKPTQAIPVTEEFEVTITFIRPIKSTPQSVCRSDLLSPISIDTRHWKWNRDEANER